MKLDVERVRLNQGGYDRRGRYWGSGAPLFRVTSDEDLPEGWYGSKYIGRYGGAIDEHVRASSAREARNKVAQMYRLEKTTARDRRRRT